MYNFFANVDITHFSVLSVFIFVIGFFGICKNTNSLINSLMSIELMLLSININFISFSRYYGDVNGQIFAIFVLAIAAAESAIGLAIIINFFKNKKTIDVQEIKQLKN